mgnify:CR=1 FL=1
MLGPSISAGSLPRLGTGERQGAGLAPGWSVSVESPPRLGHQLSKVGQLVGRVVTFSG